MQPVAASQRRKIPLYLAVLPLIFPAFFTVRAITQMTSVSAAVGGVPAEGTSPAASVPTGNQKPNGPSCVETYGVTLSNSHEYVAQQGALPIPAKRDPNKPRELATVLKGTVLNTCGEPLKNVVLHIKVSDETGNRGDIKYEIAQLKPGVAQAFEHAWMGQITTWDIQPNR